MIFSTSVIQTIKATYISMKDLRYVYYCNTFYVPYKKYKSHRTLYEVFTLCIYNYDTFYDPYNNYNTFCVPYKKYKSHRTLYKVFTLHLYDYNTFYISYNNYDTFYIPCKKYKSQVIVPS